VSKFFFFNFLAPLYDNKFHSRGEFYRKNVFGNRAEKLLSLGVRNCDCIACAQKLAFEDIKIENQSVATEMHRIKLLNDEVFTVRSAVERVAQLFDILNIHTSPTSAERVTTEIAIETIYRNLADLSMFPA
jgi:hypothetical protein